MYRKYEIKNENNPKTLVANHSFGRLRRKLKTNIDLNRLSINDNNNNCNNDNQAYNIRQKNSDLNLNLNGQYFTNDGNNSTISNSNSIHTSYKYKKYNTNNNIYNNDFNEKKSLARPCSANKITCSHNNNYTKQISNDSDKEEYLLCQNCINCKLIEEKRKQKNLENYYNNAVPDIFEDKYRDYNQKLIDDNVRQREQGMYEAFKNLKKYSNNEKDKLILENENCPNPLYDKNHNYVYEKFMDNYNKKQKMYSQNLKQYQKSANPEIDNYYNLYVNNPKCHAIGYGEYKPLVFDPIEYRNFLQNQIKQKNYLKNQEKLEDKQREIQVYENMEQKLSKENDERENRKKKLNEEFIKGNLELMNAKKAMKNKEIEEQKMYRDYYNLQNMEYKDQIKKDKQKKEQKYEEFVEENKRQLNRIKRRKDQEMIDNENYRYNDYSFEPMKEKMAQCSNCHRILPRRLLTRTKKSHRD